MLKEKSGLSRAQRKTMQAPQLLKIELEEINQLALKNGFSSVKDRYTACKSKLRQATEAKEELQLQLES